MSGSSPVTRRTAEALFRRALEGKRRVVGPYHPHTLRTVTAFARFYKRQGRLKDAERLLLDTHSDIAKVPTTGNSESTLVITLLAEVYEAQNQPDRASEWRSKLRT